MQSAFSEGQVVKVGNISNTIISIDLDVHPDIDGLEQDNLIVLETEDGEFIHHYESELITKVDS
jgi:hypothetical protein